VNRPGIVGGRLSCWGRPPRTCTMLRFRCVQGAAKTAAPARNRMGTNAQGDLVHDARRATFHFRASMTTLCLPPAGALSAAAPLRMAVSALVSTTAAQEPPQFALPAPPPGASRVSNRGAYPRIPVGGAARNGAEHVATREQLASPASVAGEANVSRSVQRLCVGGRTLKTRRISSVIPVSI
jgi:hypothetical protein